MNARAQTIEEFFIKSGDREAELRELDEMIRRYAPHLEPAMKNGMNMSMLGYGFVPYQTKSMKQAEMWPLIAIAPQKRYLSFYAMALSDGQYIAEKYEPRLGKVSCGKSCIRFKKLSDVNQETLEELIREIDRNYLADDATFVQ